MCFQDATGPDGWSWYILQKLACEAVLSTWMDHRQPKDNRRGGLGNSAKRRVSENDFRGDGWHSFVLMDKFPDEIWVPKARYKAYAHY